MDLGVGRGMVGLVVVGGVICNKSRHRRSKRGIKNPQNKKGALGIVGMIPLGFD